MPTPLSLRSAGATTGPIAVIGGGPTGLAAAYRIASSGRPVRLFEKSSRLGGAISSEKIDGWLIEGGPNSLQENSRELIQLWKELGLENEKVTAEASARKRYIVRGGKLRALPSSPRSIIGQACWSTRSTLRFVSEFFRKPRLRENDLSIEALIEDHFGSEISANVLNPFVSGIYAGDPKRLSAQWAFPKLWQSEQSHGSLIRGLAAQAKARRRNGHPRTSVISFRSGLQKLTDALKNRLPTASIVLNAEVENLTSVTDEWSLTWLREGVRHTEKFGRVILAIPAAGLAQLKVGHEIQPLSLLAQIRYSPVASLFLGFPRESVAHPLDGFGLLVPAVEKLKTLGVIFSSTLFPDRAPHGCVALTVMIGGANRPDLVNENAEALIKEVMPELKQLLGVSSSPIFQRLRAWPQAIPQYELGYERFHKAMTDFETNHPGICIGGSIRDGISLPACLEAGLRLGSKAL